MSEKTVTEVVRQQAAGVRPPSAHTGGPASASNGRGGGVGGGGSKGGHGAGSDHYSGEGRATSRTGRTTHILRDNRVADGDLHALVDSLRRELPRDEGIDEANAAHDEDYLPDENSYRSNELAGNQVDPDELAAFENIDATHTSVATSSGSDNVTRKDGKTRKGKSSPNMGNVSFGSGKRRPQTGPRVG